MSHSSLSRLIGAPARCRIPVGGQRGHASALPTAPRSQPVTALANMRDCLVAIKKDNEQAAPVAFKTLSVYVRNLGEHPEEEKFRRINMSNAAFQVPVGGALVFSVQRPCC